MNEVALLLAKGGLGRLGRDETVLQGGFWVGQEFDRNNGGLCKARVYATGANTVDRQPR